MPALQNIPVDEPARLAFLEFLRWPRGFRCPHCGSRAEPYRFATRPIVLRCRECQRDIRLTDGTAMEGSRLPLAIWFDAAILALDPINAPELQAALGLTRRATAHRILAALRTYDRGRDRRARFRAMLSPRRLLHHGGGQEGTS